MRAKHRYVDLSSWDEFWFAICIDINVILDISTTIQELQRRFRKLPVDGPTRRIFFTEIQRQGTILAPIGLCWGKMWKSNVKNIFHVGLSEWNQTTWYFDEFPNCALTYHTCQRTAGTRSGKTSQTECIFDKKCSVTILEDILTTKYGFNHRLISTLSIDNNTNTMG